MFPMTNGRLRRGVLRSCRRARPALACPGVSRSVACATPATAAPSVAQQLAEQFPTLSVETGKLQLANGEVVAGRGVYFHARQQQWQFQVFDVRRLAHDILTRQIVAALLQHVNESGGRVEAVGRKGVVKF